MQSKLYIIIVTYNGMPWLKKCLSSCKGYNVVVVDNASTDDTLLLIKESFPDVVVLAQQSNLGFGKANNIGVEYTLKKGATHVLLLNQDAYIIGNTVEALLNFQISYKEYGIVSPLHYKADATRLDEKFEMYLLKDSDGNFNDLPIDVNTLKMSYDMRFVNAAAWLISRACIEEVGGFDPIFFHYGEDDNYCQRVLYHGFKIGVLKEASIIHDRVLKKENSIQPYSKLYYRLCERKYKVRFANVLTNANQFEIQKQLKRLRNQAIKHALGFRLTASFNVIKEYVLLKRINREIAISFKKNKEKGLHYLNL